MKLNRASAYAVQALVFLATQKEQRLTASHDIAKVHKISHGFLLKVLGSLERAGIVFSLKGPHGGFRLTRPAADISVLEVVEAADGPVRGMAPLTETTGADKLDRRLDAICQEIAANTRRLLQKTRIQDLLRR